MKKAVKIITIALVALAAIICLTACSTEFPHYDDDEYIATKSQSISMNSSRTTWKGVTTWDVKGFGGVTTIMTVSVSESETLPIELDYRSGQLKIIAVTGSTVFKLIENESCGELTTELPAGTYKIRVVGSEAEFKIVY